MIKRCLLFTLLFIHANTYCDFDKFVQALKPYKPELRQVGCVLVASGAGLVVGGYWWGSSRSKAALEKKKFDIEHAKQQQAEQTRIEKARLEEKERKEKEEAIKSALLKKKEAAAFTTSIVKEYCNEIELLNADKLNEHHPERFIRIIAGKSNQKPFNNYHQTLDANIRKLTQLQDILDKQQFEYLENQLKGIMRAYNFLFSKHQHDEAMADQREKNAAEIKRIEIEHAQLQNNKLRAEEEAQIETKKAMKNFSDHTRRFQEILQEIQTTSKQIASTLISYRNAVNENIRVHETKHQSLVLKIETRETELNRKLENQTSEVKKVNTQLTEVLTPLKQLVKIAEDSSNAATVASVHDQKLVTGNPTPVTGSSSATTATPTTATESTPPPPYYGNAISTHGIQGIPVPNANSIQPIPVPS